jgi:hypothetical protein
MANEIETTRVAATGEASNESGANPDDFLTEPIEEEKLLAKVCAALKTKCLYSVDPTRV